MSKESLLSIRKKLSENTKSIHKLFYNFIKIYDNICDEPEESIQRPMKLNIIKLFYTFLIENYYRLFSINEKHYTNRYRDILFEFSKEYKIEIESWTNGYDQQERKEVLDTLTTFHKMHHEHYSMIQKSLEDIVDNDDIIWYILCFL